MLGWYARNFMDEATVGSFLDQIDTYVEVGHVNFCC